MTITPEPGLLDCMHAIRTDHKTRTRALFCVKHGTLIREAVISEADDWTAELLFPLAGAQLQGFTMNIEPKIGHYLYASCADEDYGKIIGVGHDANGFATIDIEVYDPQNLIDCSDDDFPGQLTEIVLPAGTRVILANVQWVFVGEQKPGEQKPGEPTLIRCNTPGNLCYRCTKLFALCDTHTEIQ